MTKALLKNPRTTSDHGDAPHTARPHTITNEPKKKQFLGSESQYEHQPHPNGRADARVHYPVLKPPPHQDTHPAPTGTGQPTWGTHWQPHPTPGAGGGQGTQQHAPHHTIQYDSSTPASQGGDDKPSHSANPSHKTVHKTMHAHILRRKEVIQPHLPVRLPCYDLVPITSLTLDGSIPQGVRPPASGATHFHDLTGGVYKARERIHRGVADPRLLATPPSWSRVADSNPN